MTFNSQKLYHFFDLSWVFCFGFCFFVYFFNSKTGPLNFLFFDLFSSFIFLFVLLLGMFRQLLTLLWFFTYSVIFDFQELV